jgi:hypothetical protein
MRTLTASVSPQRCTPSSGTARPCSARSLTPLALGLSLGLMMAPGCKPGGSPTDGGTDSATTYRPATFGTPSTYTVGRLPAALVAGDFTGDGQPDLVVSNQTDDNLTLLANQGNGSFSNAGTIPHGPSPGSLVAHDANGDSRLDLVVATGTAGGAVTTLLNQGDGSFQPAAAGFTFSARPSALASADLDGDDISDLVALLFTAQLVEVLHGNTDGTFALKTAFELPSDVTMPSAVLTADFNRDSRSDIAVADLLGGAGNVSVFLGVGDGTFQLARHSPSRNQTIEDLVAVDLDGNNRLDIATVGSVRTGGIVHDIRLGQGDGSFQAGAPIGTTTRGVAIGAADFNIDGKADLLVLEPTTPYRANIYLGHGDGTFEPAQVMDLVGGGSFSLAVGDWNGDGKPDFATAHSGSNDVSVRLNTTP